MKKTIGYLTMIALLTALFGSYAAAQPPGGGGFGRTQGGPGTHEGSRGRSWRGLTPPRRVLENVLEFTDEQFEALDALKADLRATIRPLQSETRGLRESIKAALESENPDATGLGESMIASHGLGQQIRLAQRDFRTSFEEILTDEQLQKLQEWKEHPRRGRGMRRPGQ